MSSPKKNVAYVFDIGLVDSATGDFKAAPTLAAGDFKVSGDDGALANLATLPQVLPAGSVIVKFSLSAAEMNFDKVTIVGIDVVGAEWDDVLIFIDVTTVNVDDAALASVCTEARLAKNDSLSFTKANELDTNIQSVIGDTVQVSSSKKTNWGGTP